MSFMAGVGIGFMLMVIAWEIALHLWERSQ